MKNTGWVGQRGAAFGTAVKYHFYKSNPKIA